MLLASILVNYNNRGTLPKLFKLNIINILIKWIVCCSCSVPIYIYIYIYVYNNMYSTQTYIM